MLIIFNAAAAALIREHEIVLSWTTQNTRKRDKTWMVTFLTEQQTETQWTAGRTNLRNSTANYWNSSEFYNRIIMRESEICLMWFVTEISTRSPGQTHLRHLPVERPPLIISHFYMSSISYSFRVQLPWSVRLSN